MIESSIYDYPFRDCDYCDRPIGKTNNNNKPHTKEQYGRLKSCLDPICMSAHRTGLYIDKRHNQSRLIALLESKLPLNTQSMIGGIVHKIGYLGFTYRENVNGGWTKVEVDKMEFCRGIAK